MLVCSRCKHTIERKSVEPVDGISHGYCARCYVLEFAESPIEELTATLDEEDALPFGRIVLDQELRVVYYSEREAELSGLSAERVLGCDFFVDVAPCMNAREVGDWCRERVNGDVVETARVDWLMEFEPGTRVATLTMAAGNGRVILEVEPGELVVVTPPSPPPD